MIGSSTGRIKLLSVQRQKLYKTFNVHGFKQTHAVVLWYYTVIRVQASQNPFMINEVIYRRPDIKPKPLHYQKELCNCMALNRNVGKEQTFPENALTIWVWMAATVLVPQFVTYLYPHHRRHHMSHGKQCVNTCRPRRNGRHVAVYNFKCIHFNEKVRISFKISLNFVPLGPIDKHSALVQTMTWRQKGDNLSFEPIMAQFTDTYMRQNVFMS